MPDRIPTYLLYPVVAIVSCLISAYGVRKILFITRSRKIYDIPDDTRKIHGGGIPSLGGIGIFLGYMITASFFWPNNHLPIHFFLPATIILFFTGIYDDLMNMRPYKKLAAQLLASAITIYLANIRITSLYGLCGIDALPYGISLLVTILGCTLFINAFNFIDGIDGLACALAILYAVILGSLFAITNHAGLAVVAICVAGAATGLLCYNYAPAKIYMGDTGSMLLGFTVFILSVVFINAYQNDTLSNMIGYRGRGVEFVHSAKGAMMIIFSVLFLPVYDALRVFILRASRGRSPLLADRAHLHYYLLDAGFSHSRSVLIILSVNILIVATAFCMQDMNPVVPLLCMILVTSVALLIVYVLRQKKMANANRS